MIHHRPAVWLPAQALLLGLVLAAALSCTHGLQPTPVPPSATASRVPTETTTANPTATISATRPQEIATNTHTPTWTATRSPIFTVTITRPPATPTSPAPEPPPPKDPNKLARELQAIPLPLAIATEAAKPYQVGEREIFWLSDFETALPYTITAVLEHVSPHLYMWVQEGVPADPDSLAASAHEFETQIYPVNRTHFGVEPSPGVDSDIRLHIVNALFEGAAGYFSSADAYPQRVNPYSNEKEMFYINLRYREPGTEAYYTTLAHEFQHMIHWHADLNEEAWVTEGASQLAELLNGYGQRHSGAFTSAPDHQLNTWTVSEAAIHYDAAFLWQTYFLNRFGAEGLRHLVQHQDNGPWGYNAVLAATSPGERFEDLYADWVIANYVDDPGLADGRYGYHQLDVGEIAARRVHEYPYHSSETVHQFGTDYVELYATTGDLALDFDGATTVRLVPAEPYAGDYIWWSNRGDNSVMTLTRAFDLTPVASATLTFALWFEIERGWDQAYVQVSTDGGATWAILPGEHTTVASDSTSYGPAYTGHSGEGPEAVWVQESIDLDAYAGQQILLRFQMITDDAVNRPGLCLDQIRIPEIGYLHTAEAGADGWKAEGFLRTNNTLPQRFLVQLITLGEETTIQHLQPNAENQITAGIEGFGTKFTRAVLAISGLTRVTTEQATYEYTLQRIE